MGTRILVPVDGSVLLRVDSWLAARPRLAEADSALEQQVEGLRAAGLQAHYLLQYGHPEDGIANTAEYQRSDLIIMAHHHRKGLERLGHRSVVAHLLSRSPTPLLIVPDDMSAQAFMDLLSTPENSILVPLDGSALAERALPFAITLARVHHQPLLLVRVVPPLLRWGVEESEARLYLEAVRERVSGETAAGVAMALVTGTPTDEILWSAEGRSVSLIAMSTHGRGGLARALVGSVATELLDRARIPLLIVPPGASSRRVSPEISSQAL